MGLLSKWKAARLTKKLRNLFPADEDRGSFDFDNADAYVCSKEVCKLLFTINIDGLNIKQESEINFNCNGTMIGEYKGKPLFYHKSVAPNTMLGINKPKVDGPQVVYSDPAIWPEGPIDCV